MQPEVPGESRFASAFATLVCAWALLFVVLGLAAPLRHDANAPTPAAVTADARP
jgi:hypothetical protein